MKKILMLTMCVALVPMLFAAYENAVVNQPREVPVDGSSEHRGVPVVVREGMNLGRQTVIDSVPAPGVDGHMGLGWDGTYLYMASNETTPILVYVIDPETGTVVNTITTGINTYILGCTFLNGSLWLQEWWTFGYTYEIDPSTGNTLSYFTSPAGTNSRGLTNDGTDLWIMDASSAIAYQVMTTGTVVRSVSMPMVQWAMDAAWNFQRGTLFLCDNDVANDIKELDVSGTTAILLDQFAHPDPGGTPEGITYDGQYLWTCSFYGAWIWQIDIGDPAPVAAFWDFEDGWQGWTHTSGQTFPAAWSVVETTYPGGSYWTYQPPPDAGDSAFIIDSDSAGIGPWVVDTAMSPAVVNPGYGKLKWGMFLEFDDLQVLLREFIAGAWGSWNVVLSYSGTTGPQWDSVDVSSYTGDSLQVAFQYDDGGGWLYGATFDNVGFYAPAVGSDVGTISYDSPTIVPENTTYSPLATVYNFGTNTETFDVTCEINPGAYTSTQTVTALDPGISAQVTFDPFTFVAGLYNVTVYTQLAGDVNPANDTLYTTVEASNWLYYDDGIPASGWAWYDAGNGWGVQFPAPGDLWVDSIAVHIWDTTWPTPGGTDATFRIYDGATEPTNIRQELTSVTVVRGDWNKFELDTTLTHFAAGENIYPFYIQVLAYPNCPGLTIDAACSAPSYMWQVLADVFSVEDNDGDWLMRIHVITETGISEWISPVTPDALMFSAPTITKAETRIEFTLPEATKTDLLVYDATGRLCTTLLSNRLCAGTHSISANLNLAAGIYFYNLKTESGINITRKFLLVK